MSEGTPKLKSDDKIISDVTSNSSIEINGSLSHKTTLHCPFTWKPEAEASSDMTIKNIENTLWKIENQQEKRSQRSKFILYLALSYEYCMSGKFDKALHNQRESEIIINETESKEQSMFVSKKAFKHVCSSNKIFLMSKMNRKEDISEIMRDIIFIEDMDNKDRATVWSIGCCVLMEYGLKNAERCIRFMKESLEFDPECAEWHFLMGKVLGRSRRTTGQDIIPKDSEIEALEYAVDKSNDPWYKVTLAQSYVEKARATHLQNLKSRPREFESEIKEMNGKSYQLYRDAMETDGDDEYVLRKCAEGFNKLHGEFRDLDLAKKCVLRALELSPGDTLLCHAAGLILKEEDSDRAKRYLMQAIENGNFSSCYHLLRMKHRCIESYDPCADMERYFEVFTVNDQRERLFAWLGAFHYYVRNDFKTALNSWLKILEENYQSSLLSESFVPWNIDTWKINISKIIINEINKITRSKNCDAEERKRYLEIRMNFEERRPDLFQKYAVEASRQNQSWRQAAPRNNYKRQPETNWRKRPAL